MTLIDAEKDTVQSIAEDLCCFFRQESVLITENTIKGHFITFYLNLLHPFAPSCT